ncbi:MAG: TetR/AcrR family transcriptional regulator [Litorimonas sp.]
MTEDSPSTRPETNGEESDAETRPRLTARGLATRNKLIAGAKEAFASRGYEMTRISDIAEAAGVSLGNVYRHFTDKDDVLLAVLRPLYSELREATGRGAGRQPVTNVDVLTERNRLYLDFYAAHRDLFRVSREAAGSSSSETFQAMWMDMRNAFLARNRGWLESLIRSGQLSEDTDAEMMAAALGSMNEQFAYTHIALAEETPDADTVARMARTCAVIWWRAIFCQDIP